ncbi:ABC transporter permease, partial [bacterium]|nr:ABC transporter permease [bacterium]
MKKLMNLRPSRGTAIFLGLLPFLLIVILYVFASDARLAENPNDKLLPSMHSFVEAIDRMAFTESKRSGENLFVQDTV